MCGLAGIYGMRISAHSPEKSESHLRAMGEALRHRGPDSEGIWLDPDSLIGLVHRRLSILDLSPLGHQPMASGCGRFMAVYNGEIYNSPELRQALEAEGWAFRGTSDTEVALAAFSAWGIESAVCRMNGMFAFAIWDRSRGELTLVRDRFGQKPLYYGVAEGVLVFGSELSVFRAWPGFPLVVDEMAVEDLLARGWIRTPRSILRDVSKLPPGHIMTIRLDRADSGTVGVRRESLVPRPYWRLNANPSSDWTRASDSEAIDACEELLSEAVELCRLSDVPLGAFLSGGVDSSTIVALMSRQASGPVRTFCVGFEESSEGPYARAIADHLGTEHVEVDLRESDVLGLVEQLPSLYDEPFGDSSQLPTYLISRVAREHVTVVLSGDAGDEVFGGYLRYRRGVQRWDKYVRVPVGLRAYTSPRLRAFGEGLGRRGAGRGSLAGVLDRLSRATFALSGWESEDQAYDRMLSSLPAGWASLASGGHSGSEPDPWRAWASRWPEGVSFQRGMQWSDLHGYLVDDILYKVDRAAMAVSLEGRIPLLDHRVVEFAMGLPERFHVRDGQGKWLLRQVLYRHVPRSLVERPKRGFGVPLDKWLCGELRPWGSSLLAYAETCGGLGLDIPQLRRLWELHQAGHVAAGARLWRVLVLIQWLRAWPDVSLGR